MPDGQPVIVAVGDYLARAAQNAADAAEARALFDAIDAADAPEPLKTVGLAALRHLLDAGWPERDPRLGETLAAAAQLLCRSSETPSSRQLGCAALHHFALAGNPSVCVRRLVHAAATAVSLGRYDLGAATAAAAVTVMDAGARPFEPVDLVEALSVHALCARDAMSFDRAAVLSERLPDTGHSGAIRERMRNPGRPPATWTWPCRTCSATAVSDILVASGGSSRCGNSAQCAWTVSSP